MQNFYGAVYADDLRLTNNLTLNLGIRYDGESPYTDRHNQLNYFDPGRSRILPPMTFKASKAAFLRKHRRHPENGYTRQPQQYRTHESASPQSGSD